MVSASEDFDHFSHLGSVHLGEPARTLYFREAQRAKLVVACRVNLTALINDEREVFASGSMHYFGAF